MVIVVSSKVPDLRLIPRKYGCVNLNRLTDRNLKSRRRVLFAVEVLNSMPANLVSGELKVRMTMRYTMPVCIGLSTEDDMVSRIHYQSAASIPHLTSDPVKAVDCKI